LALPLQYKGYTTTHPVSGATSEQKENHMEAEKQAEVTCSEEPRILEEIQVEELAIDGICGVY